MTRAADDADAIGRRLAELKTERDAIFCCTCSSGVDERGRWVKLWSANCPVHACLGTPDEDAEKAAVHGCCPGAAAAETAAEGAAGAACDGC